MGEFVHAITPEAKRLNIEVDRLHSKMTDIMRQIRPLEKQVLNIVRLAADDLLMPKDEQGMPSVTLATAAGAAIRERALDGIMPRGDV